MSRSSQVRTTTLSAPELIDLEVPERVTVRRGADGAVDADVARADRGKRDVVNPAVAGRRGISGCPIGTVGGGLDLIALGIRRFPVQLNPGDVLVRA